MDINSYWEVRITDSSAFHQGSEDAELPRVSGRRGGPLGGSLLQPSPGQGQHPVGRVPAAPSHTFQTPGTSTQKDRVLCRVKQGKGLVDAGVAAGEAP